jgi:hypothetical protein
LAISKRSITCQTKDDYEKGTSSTEKKKEKKISELCCYLPKAVLFQGKIKILI